MNPIMQMMNGSPVTQLLEAINNGMNPQAMAQQIIQQNPQAMQMIQEMQRNLGGRSPRVAAMEYCRNNGISEQDVMRLASSLGIK